jgi:L-2,4-diaminobutyrate decarboxylase
VIQQSLHLHHPRCLGHQVVPSVPLAILGDWLSDFLNNSMAVYEVGPVATAMEINVIAWLTEALGMSDQASGVLTSGGTVGNLTALLAARQNKAGFDAWEKGLDNEQPLAVMAAAECHYSISRAIKIMGLGEQGFITLPVNDRFQVSSEHLEETFRQGRKKGLKIIALVGSACSTGTGSYDPLAAMADFCQSHDLWFHVDGAHGAGAVLSEKYRDLVKGIARADSVVVDFHKMLLCPALTTAVVFKSAISADETFAQKAVYLLNKKSRDNPYDIATRTLECTKKMMALKIYLLLKVFGKTLFAEYITRTYDLARTFAQTIEDCQDFELACPPEANIVCFRLAPTGADTRSLDALNSGIRKRIIEQGTFYLVQTEINGQIYLRTTLMNPFTDINDCRQLLEKIRECARTPFPELGSH